MLWGWFAKRIAMYFIFIIIVTYILSPFWGENINLLHTTIELTCVFFGLSAFLLIFQLNNKETGIESIIGYGLLATSVFDLFHIFYYHTFPWFPQSYPDLPTRYWIIGRFTEAITLILGYFLIASKPINRYIGTSIALAFSLGASLLILHKQEAFPLLFIDGAGLTPTKIYSEYIIILLYLISIILFTRMVRSAYNERYKYIILALIFAIPAELIFTTFTSITDFHLILGHVFKLCTYYALFRGVYVNLVHQPYEKLEKSKNDINKVLDKIPLAICDYDSSNRLRFMNKKAENIFGRSLYEYMGLTPLELLEKTEVKADNDVWYIKNKEGSYTAVKYDSYIFHDDGLMHILNEAKTEQELEKLQLQTKTILDSMPSLVAVLNNSDEIINCNKALIDTLQIPRDSLMGMNINLLSNAMEYQSKDFDSRLLVKAEARNKWGEIAVLTTVDGQEKILMVQISEVRNADGDMVGKIFLANDITEKERYKEKLEQREKLAVLGQMAAGIVHEIKNPLTSIRGFNQIIMTKTNDKRIKEYTQIIEEEVNSADKVVTDFLNFAKPRKPELQEIFLSELIKSIQTMLETELFVRKVDFELIIPPTENKVLIDEGQIKQVILNIVKNALDAMKHISNPLLAIMIKLRQHSGDMEISIADNGIGMSPEEISKLGTPFYTTKDKGTGLGLSICYQIVKENNGEITVQSEVGRGTIFSITFPCLSACNLKSDILP